MMPVRRLVLSAAALVTAATGTIAVAGCSGPSYAAPGPGSPTAAAPSSATGTPRQTASTTPTRTASDTPRQTASAAPTRTTSDTPRQTASAAPTRTTSDTPSGTASTGSTEPWDSILLRYSVHGRTLTYQMSDAGYQHLYQTPPDNHDVAWHQSAGVRIRFGDGQQTGADGAGGMRCSDHGVVAFRDDFPRATHHYAKPGTYRITFTSYYCGATGTDKVTKTYTVTVQ